MPANTRRSARSRAFTEADEALVEGYTTALRAEGSHTAVATGTGPLVCLSCQEPWPCRELRRIYPGVNA